MHCGQDPVWVKYPLSSLYRSYAVYWWRKYLIWSGYVLCCWQPNLWQMHIFAQAPRTLQSLFQWETRRSLKEVFISSRHNRVSATAAWPGERHRSSRNSRYCKFFRCFLRVLYNERSSLFVLYPHSSPLCFLHCNATASCVAYGMVNEVCHLCDNDTQTMTGDMFHAAHSERFFVWADHLWTLPEASGEYADNIVM